jgi:predicted unusual protein kinase regulating ubiquinone biosynthesis (AarF/ABC1/UbiB family)
MLMKNNFVHADCHGGNILVEIQEKKSNIFYKIWESLTEAYYQLE